MSLLEVKGLCRHFGAFRAVEEVSFKVEEGEIMGFIGPNGAGKSTTMRILATLDLPTRGEVTLGGHSVVDAPDKVRPLIGYMPDRYGTYEDMTVLEFLDFFARAYGLKGAVRQARLESVMAFTGLTDLREKATRELSKGMRQRVALGRTLLHDPKLLILDEPAEGLDPRARIELRELLKALAQQGKTVLISSHILAELAEMIDTCVIIEQGRLLAQGPVSEILARSSSGAPQAELVLRLVGGGEVTSACAERLLLEQPGVTQVAVEGGAIRIRVEPVAGVAPAAHWADEAAAALLRVLVQAQLPVCSFRTRELDLEDAFMKVTRGKVA